MHRKLYFIYMIHYFFFFPTLISVLCALYNDDVIVCKWTIIKSVILDIKRLKPLLIPIFFPTFPSSHPLFYPLYLWIYILLYNKDVSISASMTSQFQWHLTLYTLDRYLLTIRFVIYNQVGCAQGSIYQRQIFSIKLYKEKKNIYTHCTQF